MTIADLPLTQKFILAGMFGLHAVVVVVFYIIVTKGNK
jgi:hypothetical protein